MNLFSVIALDVASVFACLLIVDFISGVLHWAEDTWTAPGASKLLDRWIVRDNIEHHRKPGTIRAGDYWATNRVCVVLAAFVGLVLVLAGVHEWHAYLIVALASQSNQVHLWAHSARPPRPVRWLQRLGLLQSRTHHGEHHRRPYATRYCTMTDLLNPALDAIGFWRGLERVIERCGATVQRATPARDGY
jgi:hypothetical protein